MKQLTSNLCGSMAVIVHRHVQLLLLHQAIHELHIVAASRDAAAESQNLHLLACSNTFQDVDVLHEIAHIWNKTEVIHLR